MAARLACFSLQARLQADDFINYFHQNNESGVGMTHALELLPNLYRDLEKPFSSSSQGDLWDE